MIFIIESGSQIGTDIFQIADFILFLTLPYIYFDVSHKYFTGFKFWNQNLKYKCHWIFSFSFLISYMLNPTGMYNF